MASDGVFTSTSPTYGTESAQNAFDEIRENFEFIRRHFGLTGQIPITGTTVIFTYSTISDGTTNTFLTRSCTVGGYVADSTWTYSTATGLISRWDYTAYSRKYSEVYTYSGGNIASVAITMAT